MRREREREHLKRKENKTSARASSFSVSFFAVPAQLRRQMDNF